MPPDVSPLNDSPDNGPAHPPRLRLLLLLDQMPHDPSSGAARSMRGICEMLASAGGFEVRAVATTATELDLGEDPAEYLRRAGCLLARTLPRQTGPHATLDFQGKGVGYTLLDIGRSYFLGWHEQTVKQYDRLFDDHLATFKPHLVLTYGANPEQRRRHIAAKSAGAKLVFGLRNHAYFVRGALDHCDAILTPSQFLTNRYRQALGLESTPIPPPIDFDETVARQRDPVFFTFVNPSPNKGVMFFARLAEELSTRRPDIPLLVIEARANAGALVRAGLAGGFDLRRHANVMLSPPVPFPRDYFRMTRALLAPSTWEEPAGRVAAEALVNAVPPLVSDRGGLAEMCNRAGFVLPLPPDLTPDSTTPPPPAAVEPWLDTIIRLADDETFYAQESARALAASHIYDAPALAHRYAHFFRQVACGPSGIS